MHSVKWASSIVFVISTSLHSMAASAAVSKFQMMKVGEWNIEVVESSLGPLAKAVKTKPFCVDERYRSGNWEDKAKEDLKKNGMDCALKLLKDEPALLSYDIDCKVDPNAEKKNPIMKPDTKFKGQVELVRVSDTEYTMAMAATGTGMNLPKIDTSKLPPEQAKLLEATLGVKADGGFQMTNKQKYTFASPTCSKPNAAATPPAPAAPTAPAKK